MADFEQMKKTIAANTAPLDDTSFPVAVGPDGWPIDPTT
jgi:hypothetical protein